jgi:hypothetical protein
MYERRLQDCFALKLLGTVLLKRSIAKVIPNRNAAALARLPKTASQNTRRFWNFLQSIRRKTLSKCQLRLKGLAFNKAQFRIKKRNALCHWRGIGAPRQAKPNFPQIRRLRPVSNQ